MIGCAVILEASPMITGQYKAGLQGIVTDGEKREEGEGAFRASLSAHPPCMGHLSNDIESD